MKKILISIVLVFASFVSIQCSKDPKNRAPSAVNLIYPSQNLLCIENTITFNWSEAIDPENDALEYNIIIATDRAMTNIIENETTTSSELTFILEKQTAYYWKVDALDVKNNQGTESEIFAFYTKGEGVLNYAPFASELVSPENNGQVNATSVILTWEAADANTDDILSYELYFGENSDLNLMDDTLTEKSYTVSVESGKTYSWKVNVKDQYEAKSIGQTWTFTVN
ncbi:MAG: hypothetical protein HOC83_06240 [Polaribacter sp.]|jgi:hypothetical protein|nr:hypothetical protein [Polaribacter sp.]